MNNTSRYIANLYMTLLNVRNTLEFAIDRDHPVAIYNARKQVIEDNLTKNTALKNFLDKNGEKGQEILSKLQNFVDDIYSDSSTVLVVAGGNVRVDHTQHIKIYDYVTELTEILRGIIFSYINFARKNNELEEPIIKLLLTDESLYRSVLDKLVMIDYEKSFAEYNKVMNESKGVQTPQSNFIVKNELAKYASYIRSSRQNCHLTDNKTLDLLDEGIQLLEMTEGRRQRRDNRSFSDLFKTHFTHLDEYIKDAEFNWQNAYKPIMEEMVELAKEQATKHAEESLEKPDIRNDN